MPSLRRRLACSLTPTTRWPTPSSSAEIQVFSDQGPRHGRSSAISPSWLEASERSWSKRHTLRWSQGYRTIHRTQRTPSADCRGQPRMSRPPRMEQCLRWSKPLPMSEERTSRSRACHTAESSTRLTPGQGPRGFTMCSPTRSSLLTTPSAPTRSHTNELTSSQRSRHGSGHFCTRRSSPKRGMR